MKKLLTAVLAATVILALAGCAAVQPAALPAHEILGKSAALPQDAGGLTLAYIKATDACINRVCDEKRGTAPEYISFDFGTRFPLKQAEREKLVAAFEGYGIPLDINGVAAHNTLDDHNRGFIVQYIVNRDNNSKNHDLTITVEIWYGNKGYAYYCDFDIVNDQYIFTEFENGYENIHITT